MGGGRLTRTCRERNLDLLKLHLPDLRKLHLLYLPDLRKLHLLLEELRLEVDMLPSR